MKKKVSLWLALVALLCAFALTLTACGGGGKPKDVSVTDVTLTVATGTTRGTVETDHTLGYKATEGATITVTVKKDNVTAAETDYTYTESTKTIVFHTAGSYTVTVAAEKDGKSDSASVSLSVVDPSTVETVEVSDVSLPANGVVGAQYTLAYTVTDGADVTVSVKKGSNDAEENTDYTYDADTKKFVFLTAGAYTVTIEAQKGAASDQANAVIVIEATGVFDVAIAAKAQNVKGKLGQTHVLSYNVVPQDTEVSVKVEQQDDESWNDVTANVYTESSKELVFNEVGVYKVTVSAADDASKTASATIEIAKFTATVSGSLSGGNKVNTNLQLAYEVTPETGYNGVTSPASVTVLKKVNDEYANAVENTDYTYNTATKEILFKAVGSYRVRIACTNEDLASTPHDIDIDVITLSDPAVTLSASTDTVEEGAAAVTLTKSVAYDAADTKESESIAVEYSANGGEYAQASEDKFEWVDDAQTQFKPLIAGSFRITLTAKGTLTQAASRSVDITATASPIKLVLGNTQLTNGWVRMAVSTETTVTYNVTRASGEGNAYLAGYTVSVTGENGATATVDEQNHTVTVTAGANSNTANVAVTYTHKADASVKATLTVPVSMVSNADTSPVLGEDPFGGTYGALMPGVGLMLYYDVTDGGTQMTHGQIAYTVSTKNITTDAGVVIGKMVNNDAYRYVLVEDYHDTKNHASTGTVSVTLTATNESGATAAATKVFNVQPATLGANNMYKEDAFDEYYQAVTGGSALSVKQMNKDNQDNCVISKDGILVCRPNASWLGGGDFGRIYVVDEKETATEQKQYQIDYKLTVFSADLCLKQFLHIGDGGPGVGNIDLKKADGGEIDSWGWLINKGQNGQEDGVYLPQLNDTTVPVVLYVRMTRTIEDTTVTVRIGFSQTGAEGTYKRAYETYATIGENVGNDSNTVASPMKYWRLVREANNVSSFLMENVTVKEL